MSKYFVDPSIEFTPYQIYQYVEDFKNGSEHKRLVNLEKYSYVSFELFLFDLAFDSYVVSTLSEASIKYAIHSPIIIKDQAVALNII